MRVGDIYTFSYIYNSCHPVFLVIDRMTESSVWCSKLKKEIVADDGYGQNGECVPDVTREPVPTGHSYRRTGATKNTFKIDGHTAHPWDGKPVEFWSD